MSRMSGCIFLVGARASGKTTVGRHLAALLHWDVVDTDHRIAHDTGMSIADIIAARGWDAFRREESLALRAVCREIPPSGGLVVATGGGMVLAEANRRFMSRTGTVFYLHAPAALLAARLAAAPEHGQRPPLTELTLEEEVTEILRLREPLYRETAHHVLDAALPPETVARNALRLMPLPGEQPCP